MNKIAVLLLKYIFSLFVVAVLLVGAVSYLFINKTEIVNLSLGINEEEIVAEETDDEYYIPDEDDEVVETIMQFESSPVEFLDEILPDAEPEEGRAYASVIEKVFTGGKLINNFYVSDTTNSSTDLYEALESDLAFELGDNSEPQILIYHTHTTESFLTTYTGFYYLDYTSSSTDLDRTVAAVGEVLAETLTELGFNVIHVTEIHDLTYTGSYTRSRDTVEEYLEMYPSIQITIDVHRDAISGTDDAKYKPTVYVDGRKTAQMTLIAGCDYSGTLDYDNWYENLIFNLKLQETATEMYGEIMRPLMFCERKYNMDLTNGSLLLEVGTDVNTLAEAKYSAELMANVIAQVLNSA